MSFKKISLLYVFVAGTDNYWVEGHPDLKVEE